MYSVRRLKLLMTVIGAALTTFSLAPAGASSANISHSYGSVAGIKVGSLVSLDPHQSNYVELANSNNGAQLLGVAVQSNDSLLAVDAADGKVQVATSGTVSALVSTINGSIKVGDQISVSPFNGLGAKAAPGSRVIGLAQTGFDARSDDATRQQVTDKNGKKSDVAVGYVRLNIGVGTAAVADGSHQLNGLQRFARSLTGHVVSTPRVIVSLAVAIVALGALATLIYASIYGSIISIGRNPLAKYAVFRTLATVLGMAVMTAIIAGLTIFFLLR